jgi:hypothetical protein
MCTHAARVLLRLLQALLLFQRTPFREHILYRTHSILSLHYVYIITLTHTLTHTHTYLHVLLPSQGGILRVNSVLCSVRTCRRLIQRTVLLELLRYFGHKSVVGVRVCYQLKEILKKSVP